MASHSRLLTPSNLLSVLRLLLAFPAAWAAWYGAPGIALGLCGVAGVSDILDGRLARARNEVSEAGKILDPLADKVFVGLLTVALTAHGVLPLWFAAAVIGRDLVILVAGLVVRTRVNLTMMALPIGKAAVVAIGLVLLTALVMEEADRVLDVLELLAALLMAASVVVYARRMMPVLRSR